VDADDTLDYADIDVRALEPAALLDVQLQVRNELAAATLGATDGVWITTERTDPIAHAAAAGIHQIERCRIQPAGHGAAADQSTFFVGEVHDLECMAQPDVPIAQLLGNLDAADHADITVEVAAVWHGICVRTYEDHRKLRLAPLTAADEVTRGVNPHLQSRSLHEAPEVGAALDIGLAEGDTTHTAVGVCAEVRELDQMALQPVRIRNGHLRVRCCGGELRRQK
jgi:hypothetical protein